MSLTVDQLKQLCPQGKKTILDGVVSGFSKYADSLELNTPLRKSHFLAQIAHESDHFKTTVEYGGAKARYAPWYGRGLIQTTWESNYIIFTRWCQEKGLDAPNFATSEHRDEVAKFPWAFLSAICYWDTNNINHAADADNVVLVTKIINGGKNGLDERIRLTDRAKLIFGVTQKDSTEHDTRDIQEKLNEIGFDLKVDGVMGDRTRAAIRLFQRSKGLVVDGVVGPNTRKALFG